MKAPIVYRPSHRIKRIAILCLQAMSVVTYDPRSYIFDQYMNPLLLLRGTTYLFRSRNQQLNP